jgi:hypothetical protein
MDELNIIVQEANHLFNETFDKITGYERRLLIVGTATAIKQYDTLPNFDKGKVY